MFLLGFATLFATSPQVAAQATPAATRWIASWASAQQVPEPANALPADTMRDATIREIVHLSAGGTSLRVHFSNAFGTAPLHLAAAHIARPIALDGSAVDPATDRELTFAGAPDVTIPAGAEYVSDPVPYPAAPLGSIAVSFYLPEAPVQETGHPGSRATSYVVHGNAVAAASLANPLRIDHWYRLSAVDVPAAAGGATIVALGDSITDGHATTTNGNDRWTDVLAARLQGSPGTRNIALVNEGIGGNHLLTDGLGPNALARFDRDVLAPAGVRWVIVLEGVNDLGGLTQSGEQPEAAHAALVHAIIGAYQQIIARAHQHGVRVIGATITPYHGSDYYHPGPRSEADREQVNQWIRAPGHFDAVIDFDQAVRDPSEPGRLLPVYDSGDHLHPSPAGYRAMGTAVPLQLFLTAQ